MGRDKTHGENRQGQAPGVDPHARGLTWIANKDERSSFSLPKRRTRQLTLGAYVSTPTGSFDLSLLERSKDNVPDLLVFKAGLFYQRGNVNTLF
jgi:hypothetical protein